MGPQRVQPVSLTLLFAPGKKDWDKHLPLNWWISRISEPSKTYYSLGSPPSRNSHHQDISSRESHGIQGGVGPNYSKKHWRMTCSWKFFIRWSSTDHHWIESPPMISQFQFHRICSPQKYCWWFRNPKANHRLDAWNPVNTGINYQPQLVDAGFLNHQ